MKGNLKKNDWVRIKSGVYMGDLALVASDEITAAGKVWLQLIPRIEYRPQKIEFGNKGKFNKFTPRP